MMMNDEESDDFVIIIFCMAKEVLPSQKSLPLFCCILVLRTDKWPTVQNDSSVYVRVSALDDAWKLRQHRTKEITDQRNDDSVVFARVELGRTTTNRLSEPS